MKKTATILLALLLVLFSAGSALAASVSYQDGKVTVSHSEGFYMILIDGVNTGKWVGSGMSSVTFDYPLEEGTEHQLVLLSLAGDGDIGAMVSFWAGPTPAPTAAPSPTPSPEPTATPVPEPLKLESAVYGQGVLTITVAGLQGPAQVRIDGQDTECAVEQDGAFSMTVGLREGTHTVTLYAPQTGETVSLEFYARFSPDPQAISPDALGALLKTGAGAEAPYTVSWVGDESGAVLTLTPEADAEAESMRLYLSEAKIDQLKSIGFDQISLVFGGAKLHIALDAIQPAWFSTDKAIWYYVFSLAPLPENEWRVTFEAQTSLTDTVTAGFYSGVTLIRDEEAIPVVLNGIY